MFLAGAPVFGEVVFELEPNVGVAVGMAREIVYPVGYSTDNPYLSELRWDIKPALMVGVSAALETPRDLNVGLDIQGALPISSGRMYDYDWLYLNRDDWSHRSLHDIKIEHAFIIDVGISAPMLRRWNWSLRFSAGYHLDWWSWNDAVLERLYSTNKNGRTDFTEVFGSGDKFRDLHVLGDGSPGISYEVAYHVPYAGIGFRYTGHRTVFDTSLVLGPVFVGSHDHHIVRGLHFYDFGIGGPWLGWDGSMEWRISQNGSLMFAGEIVWTPEIVGNTAAYTDEGVYQGSTAKGAGFQFWRIGATIGYRFTL
ncbi:MAG: omptin family outer membrane protease [Spirochaetaceae bacterium]|nr:omptin family outer membrane protease [Spirochaetaceae bacterium]